MFNADNLPDALRTPLLAQLDCQFPILLAGMGGVARSELVAAVSNAGGFGCLGMVREPVERIRSEVNRVRALTTRAFAVNLIPAATDKALLEAQVEACLALKVPAICLFWDVDRPLITRLKAAGITVLHQVGSRSDAEQALAAGVDILLAQGREAGGHVRGQMSTIALVAELVALSETPVVATGGIASGSALVAAIALGAQAVCCGTAFLACTEANAHPYHQQRVCAANGDETLYTTQFVHNWPMAAPVRVLPNDVTRGDYGAAETGMERVEIGRQDNAPVYRFSTDSPLRDATGDVHNMALYAGQSCGQIHAVVSAAERIAAMMGEAEAVLARLGSIFPQA
jgi:nitronate monooxygenase